MSEISNVNASNFGYYVKKQPSFGRQSTAACRYDDGECDSFEKNDGKKVAVGGAIVVPLAAATLWLTKGKGWAKLKGLFKSSSKLNNKQNDLENDLNRRANRILQKHKENKVDMGVSREEAKRKVDEAIKGIELPKQSDPVEVIKYVETANANRASRELVEQAKSDIPTSEQLEEYARDIAYVPPTKEQRRAISRLNKRANETSATNRQIQNNISEEQKHALQNVKDSMKKSLVEEPKTGIFKTPDGYTVKLKDGNIVSMVTPHGEIITKPKTLYKYQGNIDLANLEAVKA